MKALRLLLLPFGLLYGIITTLRNFLFDSGIFASYVIPGKSICVGNLNVGGSGKSPMTRYLMQHFQKNYRMQILSRGYGRSTKGHIHVQAQHAASVVGDEPLQYFLDAAENDEVHVSENRKMAIATMDRSENHLLLLDDAFQHRKVKAGLSILLSEFNDPFFRDYILPVGNLREGRRGAKRAHILVFTKCPEELTEEMKKPYLTCAKKWNVPAFFSRIVYQPLRAGTATVAENPEHILLVTGIANPSHLLVHLQQTYRVTHLRFADHFNFTPEKIDEIHGKFDTFERQKTIIVTTEKDFMRFINSPLQAQISSYPWYVQPIGISMDREKEFLQIVHQYVR